MSRSDREYLFSQWLENKLTEADREHFAQLCREDERFAARVALARHMTDVTTNIAEINAPTWDPASVYSPSKADQFPWWQSPRWSVASLLVCCIALLLMVSRLELRIDEQGTTLSFAGGNENTIAERRLEERFMVLQQQQWRRLQTTMRQWENQQQQANRQLARYLLDTNRAERKEELTEIIRFVNDQRQMDQRFYSQQLLRMQDEIYRGAPYGLYTAGTDNPANVQP